RTCNHCFINGVCNFCPAIVFSKITYGNIYRICANVTSTYFCSNTKEIAGRVLGTLQTGSVSGTLLGPLFGGFLADLFGYSFTFKLVSITLFISAFLVTFGLKEMQVSISDPDYAKFYSRKDVI